MIKRYGILLMLMLSTLFLSQCHFIGASQDSAVQQLRPLTQTEQVIANSSQSFGVDVFRNLADSAKGQNIFISPLSLSMALAMTVNGAADSTRTAMLNALDVPDTSVSDLDASYQSLMKLLVNADPQVQMELANAIWYRKTFNVQQGFIDTCQTYFNAQVQGLDFGNNQSANIINQWVSNQTNGLITNIISPPIPDSTVMYLMNAIYFKGSWRYQFDKSQTAPGHFTLTDGTTVMPEMMHLTTVMPYYQSSEVQMIDMAYGDSLFSMSVLLPPAGTNINTFIAGLTRDKLNDWISQLYKAKVQITMPKFTVAYDTTFNNVLSDMGMGVAFDPLKANFSNINPSEQLSISNVKQKSYVSVDEEGTKAAAVTSVSIVALNVGSASQPLIFDANRPFVYLIRERTSGTILFIGVMNNPTG